MDGKGGVIVFAAFIALFACLALTCLVEVAEAAPQADFYVVNAPCYAYVPPQNELQTERPSPKAAYGNDAQSLRALLPMPIPCQTERDQNGAPLGHRMYRRAAYIKFPPEGFYG